MKLICLAKLHKSCANQRDPLLYNGCILQTIIGKLVIKMGFHIKINKVCKLMGKVLMSFVLTLSLILVRSQAISKITQYKSSTHLKTCYTQGLFFLNQTHVFESCGLYNVSYFHVLKLSQKQNDFQLEQTYKSIHPIQKTVFLQGATLLPFTNKIYVLTWRQNKVYQLSKQTFKIQAVLKWQKPGWGLTSNQTHMFISDGSATIYTVDQNFKILSEKQISNQNGWKLYNINELQYVVENGNPFIYANVYMQRKIVKINLEQGKVVKQFDLLKIIQNEKNLRNDEVINGIAYQPTLGKFLITGKHWKNFYLVDLI